MQGIEKAKAGGKYKGRPKNMELKINISSLLAPRASDGRNYSVREKAKLLKCFTNTLQSVIENGCLNMFSDMHGVVQKSKSYVRDNLAAFLAAVAAIAVMVISGIAELVEKLYNAFSGGGNITGPLIPILTVVLALIMCVALVVDWKYDYGLKRARSTIECACKWGGFISFLISICLSVLYILNLVAN